MANYIIKDDGCAEFNALLVKLEKKDLNEKGFKDEFEKLATYLHYATAKPKNTTWILFSKKNKSTDQLGATCTRDYNSARAFKDFPKLIDWVGDTIIKLSHFEGEVE